MTVEMPAPRYRALKLGRGYWSVYDTRLDVTVATRIGEHAQKQAESVVKEMNGPRQ